jgi:hypothetical protein
MVRPWRPARDHAAGQIVTRRYQRPAAGAGRSRWASGSSRRWELNDIDARLWHPWLRINRVLRVMLQMRWSAEAWA